MASTVNKREQQTLTEFFAAKKSARLMATKQASNALEKLKSLHADLEEIRAKKAKLNLDRSAQKSSQNKKALSRLETKRAALKAARERLHKIEKDQRALEEFQKTKKPHEVPKVPAYEKYQHLTVPSGTLPLPAHYQKLFDGFCAADTVVSMFHNRKEVCRMEKLSLAVRKMTGNNFGHPEMSKILTLKPDAYRITVEQHRFLDTNQKMHHIVAFSQIPEGPKFLWMRKSEFKDKVLLRVAQYHQEFIDNVLPGSAIPMEALKRWHPKFRIDEIPDIPETELPKIQNRPETPQAKDVLEKVRGKFSARIEKALASLAEKQQERKEESKEGPEKSNIEMLTQGVTKDLLERIKRKEALKMAEKMVMGDENAKESRVLSALPSLIRGIRQVFLSSQKAALLYSDLTAKIHDFAKYDDLDALMTRLSEVAPEWYKPLKVRNKLYVKIDKSRDINILCARIENMLKDGGSAKGL